MKHGKIVWLSIGKLFSILLPQGYLTLGVKLNSKKCKTYYDEKYIIIILNMFASYILPLGKHSRVKLNIKSA